MSRLVDISTCQQEGCHHTIGLTPQRDVMGFSRVLDGLWVDVTASYFVLRCERTFLAEATRVARVLLYKRSSRVVGSLFVHIRRLSEVVKETNARTFLL